MRPPSAARALDFGIEGLRVAYAAGLDPVQVIDEVLSRIDRDGDPAIWIDVESAAQLRRTASRLREVDREALPLWGVPFGVKDNIDVEARTTTCGVPGLARRASQSATVVRRLVAAGAVYVGKTNLDQLATGLVGTRSPYGTPVNPLDSTRIPGGSSSGSAAAVARRQVAFALGTDTAGSGRVPAAMCGVVGMKGSPGTRPTDGIQPASPSIDCVSTFAGSVADGIEVERVLAAAPWPVASGPMSVAITDVGSRVTRILAAAGHHLSPVDMTLFHEAGDLLYGGPWLAERTAILAPLLAGDPAGIDPVVRMVIAGGAVYRGTEVFDAQRRLGEIIVALAPLWDEVDVLVVPTVPWAPGLDEVAADPIGTNLALGRNTTFANLLGLAAIAVPSPFGPGGVTVLGPSGHRGAVAAVAGTVNREQLTTTSDPSGTRHLLAVVGAHLRGQPLNHQLVDRGAELVERTTTAPRYRLHRLTGKQPLRPALERATATAEAIEVEVWVIDDAGLGAFTAEVAAPLGIGSVELVDGRWVKGFICEGIGLLDAEDITAHHGWRSYLASAPAT